MIRANHLKKTSTLNNKTMNNTLTKLILLFISVFMFIPKGYSQNNADPGISIVMNPSSVAQGSTGILSAIVGNYGNETIVKNSLRVTISVDANTEIIGIASGSDTRWNQVSLTTGSANTIKLTNSSGAFNSFDVGSILLTVRGNMDSEYDVILGNIVYITSQNPLLCGGCASPPLNASQGNAITSNDNAQTSLAVEALSIDAVNDTAGPINGDIGGDAGIDVLDNDMLNGVIVDPADVTISSTPTPELTVNTDGSVDVTPGTPKGTYMIDYTICENNNPTNCDIATVTVNVIVPCPEIDTPVVSAVDNCNGTSTLGTNATGTLLWSTTETTSSITVNSAGDYTVTATVDGCTSYPGTGTAAPNEPPADQTVNVDDCDQANAGTVVTTATNAAGCDYQVTTITTWTGQADQTVNVGDCDQANAGTIVTTATNAAGCDYQVTTITTWTGQADQTVNVGDCDQANAGTVVTTATNAAGCDYQVTTITTWTGQADQTVNVGDCDQANAGTVVTTATNAAGCDYQVTTITTWTGQADQTVNVDDCDQANAGTVVTTATNAAGCDYQVTTITTWTGQADQTVNVGDCDQANAGTVVMTATNAAGCDYQVTTITTWTGQADQTVNVYSCIESEACTVATTETNASGCDYQLTTITTWIGTADQTVNVYSCIESEACTIVTTATNATGCDYQVTIITTWTGQADQTVNVYSCIESEACTVVTTETNAEGCEYEVTTITTWIEQPDENVYVKTCDSYFWELDGMTYTEIGIYIYETTNEEGCEYNTYLHLTIDKHLTIVKEEFVMYPVPFNEEVFARYNFSYDTSVKVEIFDLKGALIRSYINSNYIKDSEGITRIHLSNTANQFYNVKLTTAKETLVKKIVSSSH
jgi:hypothetical protein